MLRRSDGLPEEGARGAGLRLREKARFGGNEDKADMDTTKVTRFEVIDENGRAYVRNTSGGPRGVQVDLALQDDGRTLKVFVKPRQATSASQ